MQPEIERLLLEAQRSALSERRTEPRHPFVRPVRITVGDDQWQAFARDLSKQGMGTLSDRSLGEGSMAVLSIHSTTHHPVHLRCEVRWCDSFGRGWYLIGWKFISAAPDPRPGRPIG